jgi:hypothetical protein
LDLQLGILERPHDEVATTQPLPQVTVGENHVMASIMEVA